MYSASLKVTSNSKILEALDLPHYKRSKVAVKGSKGSIAFEIESEDVVALVATLSSIVKQLRVISSVGSLVGKEGKESDKPQPKLH